MPAAVTEPPLPAIPNSANPRTSFDGPPRKSHDKTIGGVFTYTNGTDVDTGLPDHRLDQLKNFRNGSNGSLTNGIPNGSVKNLRDRASSKAGSIQSVGSASTRNLENLARNHSPGEGLSKLSSVDNVTEAESNGAPGALGGQTPELGKLRTNLPQSRLDYDSPHRFSASTAPDTAKTDCQGLALVPGRGSSQLSRFSSPPSMSSGPSYQDRQPDTGPPVETPKLIHRHTLQVPKASAAAAAAAARPSREFSYSGGPSEEAMGFSTSRFSPTRDQFDTVAPRQRRASLNLVRRTTRSMHSDAHIAEVHPDEDAERWTELIKQKRASKRKRKEEEDDDRVIVGKKVDEGHVNYVTAYNMLTGIRFTVSRTNAKMDRELTDADFEAKHKFSFDITGNELTPSAKYDFKFKDYSPWVFRHLRTIFGLDPADYLVSLTSKYILSELGSPGKSGSFFYFSRDYKYIIKTIHHAEHKLLRRILRQYYKHVVDNPNTLISQFYGLHRVKIAYGRKIHFVVMNNLFPPHRDIHMMFDLKGSTIGRDFKEEDLVNNPRATLKDLNWLRRDMHLEFEARIRDIFLEQMRRDVALLQKLHIMDYSMLVGIHDLERGNEENVRQNILQVFQPGGEKDDEDPAAMLTRTPSRLESARKARELRLTLKREKPIPMGMMKGNLPEEISSGDGRQNRIFYNYDGGIRATHEDGRGGESIYYLGIIDCLTHYGFVKRVENFWKGLSAPRMQISPIPPHAYGERFCNFITGITMTREEAERRKTEESLRPGEHSLYASPTDGPSSSGWHGIQSRTSESDHPAQSPHLTNAVEKTMRKAQKQTDKATNPEKGRSGSEDEKPDRTLHTVPEPKGATMLPIVSEASESTDHIDRASLQGPTERASDTTNDVRLSSLMIHAGAPIPHLRKVSASTAGDGTQDDTEISRPQEKDFELHRDSADNDVVEREVDRPPRIDSDLIKPQSPLSTSLMRSLNEMSLNEKTS